MSFYISCVIILSFNTDQQAICYSGKKTKSKDFCQYNQLRMRKPNNEYVHNDHFPC